MPAQTGVADDNAAPLDTAQVIRRHHRAELAEVGTGIFLISGGSVTKRIRRSRGTVVLNPAGASSTTTSHALAVSSEEGNDEGE